MSLSTLLGQPTALTTLRRALSTGRIHHAYRFVGPKGVGKETAAFLMAQALLCEQGAGADGGCGVCSACKRVMTFTREAPHVPTHPDVILVGRGLYPPQLVGGASEATGISVEQVRRIVLSRLGFTPHEGRALVVIIRDADELTGSAANALLKTLEEPHPNTHFLLLTHREAKLLDTIVSRTLAVRFGPLPDAALRTLLEQEGLPEQVALYAQGSLEKARALADAEFLEARAEQVAMLDQALREATATAALKWAEHRPEGRHELLALLAHIATTYAARARDEGAATWAARYAELIRASREIEHNGSPALVLEAMVLRLIQC